MTPSMHLLNCLRHYASSWLETEAGKTTEQLTTALRDVLKATDLTAQEAWTAADDREGWRAQWSIAAYAF